MFTGIAEELGLVKEFKQKSDTVEIKISCKKSPRRYKARRFDND